ncbi:MAG: NAD(P)-dependent oxidoreductase [Nitrospinota bacterium]|jgi:2-hydroxy-3-oxopropionate reductase|nr:NAD(P)-dependent oxidoreductase [Nitrospinota bacterium]MDP6367018.1 NAD(P)-dependent oxidoreductase [Nitrospinota bacterium]MDP7168442.1 NAD(P)-dependent oxidoreductase [Nitrospinota bacterium]MDP7369443.1 NAD(P)-dependent oxidoreductase [Nitrospinota bacterium]MDP7662508.1 NAD(P)-dependent oxidoreductase [Nitrospinota bacterium]
MAERVGIAGIGLMGSALSAHLIEAGFEVQGFDVDGKRVDEFAERGGIPVDSPAAAAKGSRWMVTSLPTSDIVREVVFGEGGIVETAEEGMILADATTSRPEDSERLGAELTERGIRFLDAAVSGTSVMAWEKDLIIIAGGEKEDFDACRPYFKAISRAAYHMGPVGSGAVSKLIINLILAGNRLALAEGLTLGTKAGMEMNNLLTVLQDAACSSKTMIDKGPKMVNAEYSPEGLVRISLKDSRLMLEQGQRFGSPMMLTSVWSQVAQAAYNQGLAEKDSVAFYEVLRGMAGLEKRID